MIKSNMDDLIKKYFHEDVFNRTIFTVCLAVLVVILVLWKISKKKYKLPPGPTGLPILGYIPFLGSEPHKELDRLRKIYGNVFSLYLGQNYIVFLGDFEAVKEAFSKLETFARPIGLFDFIPDGAGFTSASGEEWSEQRKFCIRSMKDLGVGRDKWESIIQEEVEDFAKIIASFRGEPVEISRILTSSVSNNISSFVLGKRLPLNHPDRMFLDAVVDEIMQFLKQTSIYTFFPVLVNISIALRIGKVAKLHRRVTKFNNFFRKEVEKLRETYKNGNQENFIVDYLKEMDNNKGKPGHFFNETNLYGNIQTLFIGGSDTTKNSIYWLFLAMASFPDTQDKVQNEVDFVLGRDGKIQWSDRKKLPYTYATIMEAQRWRTIVPLNPSRITMRDIKIQDYDIPKGTTIISNNWALHNDTRYWKEPEKFDPNRFLTEDGKEIVNKLESYNPFSYGKRNCPGDRIVMMEILLYFTTLMQKFTITAPEGKKINLEGESGLTYRAFPQDLSFIPRE